VWCPKDLVFCERKERIVFCGVFRLVSQMRENGELLNGGSSEVIV